MIDLLFLKSHASLHLDSMTRVYHQIHNQIGEERERELFNKIFPRATEEEEKTKLVNKIDF